MTHAYVTVQGRLTPSDDPWGRHTWVHLLAPTAPELESVEKNLGVPADFLRAALDEEERPRIEFDDDAALIILSIPVVRGDERAPRFDTLPLSVIITRTHLVTVCLEPNGVLDHLIEHGRIHTAKRTQFLLQVLYRTATLFLRYLRQIDRRTDSLEKSLHRSMRNEELIRLFEMEKSLVYFTTSLRSNQIVMDKLLRLHLRRDKEASADAPGLIHLYEDDQDLLEDVITENRQAIEMADVYTSILSGTLDAFASLVSNNVNIVVKFLTSVTIVLALPTMVASFYGMNVPLPLQDSPYAFLLLVGLAATLSTGAAYWLLRRF
ncbi:MAG TPA: magnesium transporter CorA family protein [Limnochordia bacterium]